MIIFRKDATKEIKKNFPKFNISPNAKKYFENLNEQPEIIKGDMYKFDEETIININKQLPSITGPKGEDRLVIAAPFNFKDFICIEKDGTATLWSNTSNNFSNDFTKYVIFAKFKSPADAINAIKKLY